MSQDITKFCIDSQCQEQQKIIYKMEDCYLHWGHKIELFKTIHQELRSETNQKRFKEMISKRNLQCFVKEQMNNLFLIIKGLVEFKIQQYEEQISRCQDDNRLVKQLYEQINQDFDKIDFNYLRKKKDGWEGLFKQKDSDDLVKCKRDISEKIQHLEKDIKAVFSRPYIKNKELEVVQKEPLEVPQYELTINQQQLVQFEMKKDNLQSQQIQKSQADNEKKQQEKIAESERYIPIFHNLFDNSPQFDEKYSQGFYNFSENLTKSTWAKSSTNNFYSDYMYYPVARVKYIFIKKFIVKFVMDNYGWFGIGFKDLSCEGFPGYTPYGYMICNDSGRMYHNKIGNHSGNVGNMVRKEIILTCDPTCNYLDINVNGTKQIYSNLQIPNEVFFVISVCQGTSVKLISLQ